MTKACSRGKCCVRKGFFFFLKRTFLLLLSGPTPPSPKSVKTFKVARTKHRYLKRQEGTDAVIGPTPGRVEVL